MINANISLPPEVSLVRLSMEKLQELWEKLKDFDKLYTDTNQGNEMGFYKRLMSGDMVIFETAGGIMIVDHLVPYEHAQVHVSFWDHKLSAKTDLLKKTMNWVVDVYQLNRLEALIPAFSKALERFLVKRMGFVFEGRLRKRLLYQGQFRDVLVYSILREEILNG